MNVEFYKDQNLIWRQGNADGPANNYRLIILRLQLFVPRLTFNAEGQKLYMENYLKPYRWTYLNENVERSDNSKQKQVILELQMLFENQDMFFYFSSTLQILMTKEVIHFCITLLVYQQTQEH